MPTSYPEPHKPPKFRYPKCKCGADIKATWDGELGVWTWYCDDGHKGSIYGEYPLRYREQGSSESPYPVPYFHKPKLAVTTCPKCGAEKQVRWSKKTGEWFSGCSKFPACKWSLNIIGTESMSEWDRRKHHISGGTHYDRTDEEHEDGDHWGDDFGGDHGEWGGA